MFKKWFTRVRAVKRCLDQAGSLIFRVEGSGHHSAGTGDFPSHAGQHDW